MLVPLDIPRVFPVQVFSSIYRASTRHGKLVEFSPSGPRRAKLTARRSWRKILDCLALDDPFSLSFSLSLLSSKETIG